MKLYEIIRTAPKYKGPVMGIEVEMEGINLPAIGRECNWEITVDGSLRGESAEYISKKPLQIEGIKSNILYLSQLCEDAKTKTNFSNRTSVHVHLNVLDLELQTYANIVYLYYLFEDVLLRYCGENRHNNRFCLSIRNAEGVVDSVMKGLNWASVFNFSQDRFKYASLNLASLSVHGSLEFRGMRGTLDKNVLFPWLDVIYNIYCTASLYKNPQEILETLQNDPEKLTNQIFMKHKKKFEFAGFENEVAYNASLCAELPQYLSFKEEVQKPEAPRKRKAPEPRWIMDEFADIRAIPAPLPPQFQNARIDDGIMENHARWRAVYINPNGEF